MRALLVLLLSACACFSQGFTFTDVAFLGNKQVAAAGAPWTPASEASVVMWVDPTTIAQSDNTSVNTWTDSSSYGTNTLYVKVNAPKFWNNVKNGKGAVANNGNGMMTNMVDSSLKPVTFAFVTRTDSDVSTINGLWSVLANPSGALCVDVSGGNMRFVFNNATVIGTTPVAASQWYAVVATYDGSGNYAFYTNGAAGLSGTSNQTLSTGKGGLMGAFDYPSYGWRGTNGDFIIANTAWGSTTRANFFTWANAKWAIY